MANYKKLLTFFALCLAVLGAIGGACYLLYDHHAIMAVGEIVIAWLAWPRFKELVNYVLE